MSRRWSDLDTDSYRLPPGFTRTGYDSNTRRYYFSDEDGHMYQGEPGQEFGGHLTPVGGIDASTRHRFAPEEEDEEKNVVGSPPNSPEGGNSQLVFVPAGETTRHGPQSPSSFSDFLSSNQIAAATPINPQKKEPPQKRSSTFSLRRATASILTFASTKSKRKSAPLPSLPPPGMDEWGVVRSPQSAKF